MITKIIRNITGGFWLLVMLFIVQSSYAQPDTVWTRSYIGASNVRINSSRSGGYIIGSSYNYDFYLIKTDTLGLIEWSETYSGRLDSVDVSDQLRGLTQLSDNGYLMVGNTGSGSMVVRTNSDGEEIWQQFYRYQNGYSLFYNCLATPDDELFITGNEVLKLDADGDVLWRESYPWDRYSGYFNGIIPLYDGNWLLYGVPNPMGGPDFYAVKINEDGEEISNYLYGTEGGTESCGAAVETSDNGWCLVGGQITDEHSVSYIVRTDQEGNAIWQMEYEIRVPLVSVVETSDGGFSSVGRGPNNSLIQIRVDCNGDTLWTKRYGFWRDDNVSGWATGRLSSIILLEDSSYVVGGYARGGPYNGIFLARTEPDPVELPMELAVSDTLLDFGVLDVDSIAYRELQLTNPGRCLSKPDSVTIAGGSDVFTLLHEPFEPFYPWDTLSVSVSFAPEADSLYAGLLEVWLNGESLDVALSGRGYVNSVGDDDYPVSSFVLYPAYPNPFNSTTTISFTIPHREVVILEVLDMHGRCVDVLMQGQAEAGNHMAVFDASGIPSGIYFSRLKTKEESKMQKMVLVR